MAVKRRFARTQHCFMRLSGNIKTMGNYSKYPCLYHRWLLGILQAGGSLNWKSKCIEGNTENKGVSDLELPEGKGKSAKA